MRHDDVSSSLEHHSDGGVEVGVADARTLQPREQVLDQTQEQRHVLEHELRVVHISVIRKHTKVNTIF